MRRDVRALLEDIQYCIRQIEIDTGGLRFEAYDEVELIQHATERNFTVIGQAIKRMHLVSDGVSRRIGDAVAITGFRNFVVHEYEQIDNKEVWRIIHGSLPRLKEQVNGWAEELGMRRWD